MPSPDYDRAAPRKATNLSVNADLLRLARELGVNLSRALEHRLEEIIAEERRRAWLAENEPAIEAYNDHVERSGVFSDGLRTFLPMPQFDVYKNTAASKSRVPFLLDVQADLLRGLATRVVVPLVKPAEVGNKMIRDLHFEVEVRGQRLIALGSELAAIPVKALGPRVGSLAANRTDIVRAIDIIISGL